jgi:predicted O-methyltransferase YrrM
MQQFNTLDGIQVDEAHVALINGIVKSQKPQRILELGLGSGTTTDAILEALQFNQQPFEFTLVDLWLERAWGGDPDTMRSGTCPPEAVEKYSQYINIVTSDEREYVFNCGKTFDFIMSDADHHNTQKWFEYVYAEVLEAGGTLIYHDVTDRSFTNLREIYEKCKLFNLRFTLFNKNSRSDERCDRGLLVIYKPEE